MHSLFKYIRNWDFNTALRADFIAGLTTAILLVPQAMAYATLAGLPPVVGLYASTLPLLAYAFIGTSRVMAVGPVALISLMTASALAPYAESQTTELVVIAGALALMVGLLQLIFGLLRLDFLTNLLSRPVLTGFTSAAALLIGTSQLPALLGTESASSWELTQWHVPTVIIGLVALAGLLAMKKIHRGIPAALIVLILTTVAVIFFGLDARGVDIVGTVPAGLPTPTIPMVQTSIIIDLLPAALAIGLVSYLESFAVGRALARQNGESIHPGREWMGIGAANLASSTIGGYPVAGGFSRSAVNATAGARTRVAGVMTALLVLATLALLTPLFTNLPQAALAAIIIVAVLGLIHIKDWKYLAQKGRSYLAIAIITAAATLVFSIEIGLIVGIGAAFIIQRNPHPKK